MTAIKNSAEYRDSLVEIGDRRITFFHYGFFGRPRTVAFKDIETIDVMEPTIWNGKYRYHGTGDFRTWFPRDFKRSNREKIFRLRFKNKWKRIGFTVEDDEKVLDLFKKERLTRSA